MYIKALDYKKVVILILKEVGSLTSHQWKIV